MSVEQTVFVVDDDQVVRHSLCRLLASVRLPVEDFASARAFLDAYQDDRPGCLVTDARMPGLDGLELLQIVASRQLPVPVIMITGHGDVAMAVRAMRAGAFDFLEKPYNGQVLLERVREAFRQDARTRELAREIKRVVALRAALTARENEVLDQIVAGHATRVIARQLGVSPKTVEGHRAKVMEKMGTENVAQLVRITLIGRCHISPRHGGLLLPAV